MLVAAHAKELGKSAISYATGSTLEIEDEKLRCHIWRRGSGAVCIKVRKLNLNQCSTMFFSCLYGDLRIMKSERSEWNNSRLEPDSLTVRVFQAAKGVCKVGNRRNDQSDFLL